MKNRIRYVDMAKGLAVISVVMGHVAYQRPSSFAHFLFAFHMPLFFIASGYFFKQEGITVPFLKKSVRQLLRPYAIACLATILCNIVMDLVDGNNILPNIIKWLSASLYGSGTKTNWPYWFPVKLVIIGLPWFFLALFWSRLILASIIKMFPRSLIGQAVLICAVTYCGAMMGSYTAWLPFSLYAGFAATLFVWLGYLFRQTDILEKPAEVPIIVICVMLCICAANYIKPLYMVSGIFNGGLMNVVAGTGICYLILKACRFWDRRNLIGARLLSYVGKNSLWFVIIHHLEDRFVDWFRTVPDMLRSIGIPANYWTVAAARCSFIICVYILIRLIVKAFQTIRLNVQNRKVS